jgi:hypothetical protein
MDATTEDRTTEEPHLGEDAREHLDAAQHGRLIEEHGETTGDEGSKLLVEAAGGKDPRGVDGLSPEQKVDAMAWLLADSDEGEDTRVETWQFNVGTEQAEEWIDWTIQPIDADMMTSLRQRARGSAGAPNRAQRRRRGTPEADFDVSMFNLFMVAAATISPDLVDAANRKGVGSADPLEGPVMLIKHKFRNKPGIVDQIAQKVMLFSGYDEEDARRATPETVMVRAAGN